MATSAAIEKARARRAARAKQKAVETEWFIDQVNQVIQLTLRQRVRLATEYLKNKVVLNISKPVKKVVSRRRIRFVDDEGRNRSRMVETVVVTERSRPGEFPRADTTQLMKTIFGEVKEYGPGVIDGFVGTPLDYGLKLELMMQRSFLVRTWTEERDRVIRILTGPIKGISNQSSSVGS